MSTTVMGRVFWTQIPSMQYKTKTDTPVKIGPQAAKLVLLAIADACDDYGENSWQSFDTIGQKASLERRSVMRVVRALIEHNYLSIAGASHYGTNNYKINLDLLGSRPPARAKNGRPKTGDSDALGGDSSAETGDSSAETGDTAVTRFILNHPNPSMQKRGDLVDGYIQFSQSPGIKKSIRLDNIASALHVSFGVEPSGRAGQDFCAFVDERQQKDGHDLAVFIQWLKNRENFNVDFWPWSKMREHWWRAFEAPASTADKEDGIVW